MKAKTLFLISNLLLFFFAGLAVFYFVNVLFTDAINEFRRFGDFLPLYITVIIPIYSLIAVNRIADAEGDNAKLRKIKFNSLVLLITSLVCLVYGFINAFVSLDGDFLAGGPSKYFPLSFMILDIAFAAIFGYILYIFREEKVIREVKKGSSVIKIILDVIRHLYLLFALYFLGTFAFGFYSFDLSLQHVAGTLPVYLLMILPSAFIIAFAIINKVLAEEKRQNGMLILAISSLGGAVVFGVWMFIYMSVKPNFVTDALTASFPLDFAISLNLGPILVFVLSLLPGLILLIKDLLSRYCPFCIRRHKQNADKKTIL